VSVTTPLVRHRRAPLIAVAAGFPLALGFTAAHMLPTWSVLSDSFVDGHVSAFSWFASLLEIAGALALGLAGVYVLRKGTVSAATTGGAGRRGAVASGA
jgi:hypothetical protein